MQVVAADQLKVGEMGLTTADGVGIITSPTGGAAVRGHQTLNGWQR